jgi:hypothetical protein
VLEHVSHSAVALACLPVTAMGCCSCRGLSASGAVAGPRATHTADEVYNKIMVITLTEEAKSGLLKSLSTSCVTARFQWQARITSAPSSPDRVAIPHTIIRGALTSG